MNPRMFFHQHRRIIVYILIKRNNELTKKLNYRTINYQQVGNNAVSTKYLPSCEAHFNDSTIIALVKIQIQQNRCIFFHFQLCEDLHLTVVLFFRIYLNANSLKLVIPVEHEKKNI